MVLDVPPLAQDAEDYGHFLVVKEGEAPGHRIEVGPQGLLVGRGAQSDLRFQDGAVSNRHCRLRRSRSFLRVEDLNSTNGTFIGGERIRGFGRLDVDSLLQVGNQVLAYEVRSRREVARAREMDAELTRARSYVEALLPTPVQDADVRSDWCLEPCEVLGGDAFGHHRLTDGRLAIYLIDVSGHGAAAALHSVSVINALRGQTLAGVDFGDPAGVLTGLNRLFPMDLHDDMCFTIWYGVYDGMVGELVYASAGHPPALLIQPGGNLEELATPGMGIGMLPETRYQNGSCCLCPDSLLYVFSDGVFEFKLADGRRWSQQEFIELVAAEPGPAAREIGRIRDSVHELAESSRLPDDFSLMVFSLHPLSKD